MDDSTGLERQRLAYLARRDGEQAAAEFARRTYGMYRQSLRTPYGRVYRRELIESCLVFRRTLGR